MAGLAARGRMAKGTAFRREAGADNRDDGISIAAPAWQACTIRAMSFRCKSSSLLASYPVTMRRARLTRATAA
jgi:hypothetical protein